MKPAHEFLKKIRLTSLLRGTHLPRRSFVDPLREWTMCLGVTILGAILLLGYLAIDFYVQSQEIGEPVVANHKVPVYHADEVAELITVFGERKRNFNELRRMRPLVEEVALQPVTEEEKTATSSTLAGEEGEQYTSPEQ